MFVHKCYNSGPMHKLILDTLLNVAKLPEGSKLVVGVSGGPDSLALLHGLSQLNYQVKAAHLNHGIRENANKDAEEVRVMAEALDVDFEMGVEDVTAHSIEQRMSIEEAARILRYKFLFDSAKDFGAQAVLVGHTANDQIETVLMHLLRGTGLAGLRGMQVISIIPEWSESIYLVRPLLGVWREEIIEYCAKNQLQPIVDESNYDTKYLRNKLRHNIIPILESVNPKLGQGILRMANTLAADFEVIEILVNKAWDACIVEEGDKYLGYSVNNFVDLHLAVRRGLLRRGMAHLRPGLRDIDFDVVMRAIDFFDKNSTASKGQVLIGGMWLLKEDDIVWLLAEHESLPPNNWPKLEESLALLEIPGEIKLSGGWVLAVDRPMAPLEDDEGALMNNDPYQTWIDADECDSHLTIRPRQPGDRFKPIGMGGHHVKISDLFTNEKLPQRARDTWPLVLSGNEIVWVPGFRVGYNVRLTEKTKLVIKLQLLRLPEIE